VIHVVEIDAVDMVIRPYSRFAPHIYYQIRGDAKQIRAWVFEIAHISFSK